MPAIHLALSAPGEVVAGDILAVTVTAQDDANQTAKDYAGTIDFTSSDAAATLPHEFKFREADQGEHTFRAILRTAGSQSITATDTADDSITGTDSILVTHAALDHFQVSAPDSALAGKSFPFTITALDKFDNTVTDYTGTAQFSSFDPNATLPHDFTFTEADEGEHTFRAILRTADVQTITVTDAADDTITGSADIQVDHAALDHFQISATDKTVAGDSFDFTVTAQDRFGNTVNDYAGTVHFTSSDDGATLPDDYTFTEDDQGVHTFSATLVTAGLQTITATDAADDTITGSADIQVDHAALDHFQISATDKTVAGDSFDFTVTAQDRFGNTVNDYAGTVHFTSTDDGAALPDDYTFTEDDQGVHTFSATLVSAGLQTITATDAADDTITGSADIQVDPAAVDHFHLSAPDNTVAGEAFELLVIAQDQFGNTVTEYTGTVQFSSSDDSATLPDDYVFTPDDQGQHTFTITLATPAVQTVAVTDAADPNVSGSIEIIVQGP